MFGKCKICGYSAGIFNLVNGLCKSCRNQEVITLDTKENNLDKRQLEDDCSQLISRQKAKLGLEKATTDTDLTTEEWVTKIVDLVAAELMTKYGLSQDESHIIVL